jgi:hypothetical protein
MSNVKNLINAISTGDTIGTESYFNSAIAEKIAGRLETMRQDVSQNMFNQQSFVEEVDGEYLEWINESDYLNLSEEEQQEWLSEEDVMQLDELMGKGSIAAIKKVHRDAAYGADGKKRSNGTTDFHGTQSARASHIASKIDTRAKYGKDSQHYHEYGSDSKTAKDSYARLSSPLKKRVTQTLGKEYTGRNKNPEIHTKGKTTIHNPHTKAQNYDSAVHRTKVRTKEMNGKALPDDKKTIKGGRD